MIVYSHFEDADHRFIGASVEVREQESQDPLVPTSPWHRIGLDEIAHGIETIKSSRIVNDEIRNSIVVGETDNDAGSIDIWGADAIIQAHLFGQLVYG